MRIVLLGPPGSGKGTQAVRLAARYGVPHIATGDLFRIEIAAGSDLGLLANEYIANGNLVPNDVTNRLVKQRLEQGDAESFVLDGYPRTVDQAHALDEELRLLNRPLTVALAIAVPDDAIVERAVGRQVCPVDGTIYHLRFKPPQVAGICDLCRSALVVRDDDTPSTVRHRLAVYHRVTEPIRAYYRAQGLAREVEGVGPPDTIFDRLVAQVEKGW